MISFLLFKDNYDDPASEESDDWPLDDSQIDNVFRVPVRTKPKKVESDNLRPREFLVRDENGKLNCPTCEFICSKWSHMRRHVTSVHKGVKGQKRDERGRKFADSASLKQHKEKQSTVPLVRLWRS